MAELCARLATPEEKHNFQQEFYAGYEASHPEFRQKNGAKIDRVVDLCLQKVSDRVVPIKKAIHKPPSI